MDARVADRPPPSIRCDASECNTTSVCAKCVDGWTLDVYGASGDLAQTANCSCSWNAHGTLSTVHNPVEAMFSVHGQSDSYSGGADQLFRLGKYQYRNITGDNIGPSPLDGNEGNLTHIN